MRSDPILDEIHAIRQELAREHDDDLTALFRSLRAMEEEDAAVYVRLPPRPPTPGLPGSDPDEESTREDAA